MTGSSIPQPNLPCCVLAPCVPAQRLEEQVDHLHEVVASMRAQNIRLTMALSAAQSELVCVQLRPPPPPPQCS